MCFKNFELSAAVAQKLRRAAEPKDAGSVPAVAAAFLTEAKN